MNQYPNIPLLYQIVIWKKVLKIKNLSVKPSPQEPTGGVHAENLKTILTAMDPIDH